VVVAAILGIVLILGVLGLVRLFSFLAYHAPRVTARVRLPERMCAPVSAKVAAVFWVVFLTGVGATLYFARRSPHDVPPPEPLASMTPVHRVAVAWLIVTSVGAALARWQYRRGQIHRAMKRAESGDVDGAISDLRREISARGRSPERLQALARILVLKGNWIDARKLLLEAEDVSGDLLAYRGDMAVVLRNLGRTADALAVIEPLVNSPAATLESVCISCGLLIDLRRVDEARDRVAKAEAMFKKITSRSPSDARELRPVLDGYRELLEKKLAERDSGGGEEL
jgi:hypothetical protein